jgi:hypothetical protein
MQEKLMVDKAYIKSSTDFFFSTNEMVNQLYGFNDLAYHSTKIIGHTDFSCD